LFQFLNSLV